MKFRPVDNFVVFVPVNIRAPFPKADTAHSLPSTKLSKAIRLSHCHWQVPPGMFHQTPSVGGGMREVTEDR